MKNIYVSFVILSLVAVASNIQCGITVVSSVSGISSQSATSAPCWEC